MSYQTGPHILFQVMGGFCLTQLFYPKSLLPSTSGHSDNTPGATRTRLTVIPGVQTTLDIINKAQAPHSTVLTTLPHDIEWLKYQYNWGCAVAVAILVLYGGGPAMLGCGVSLCFGGEDGDARYTKMKRWWKEQSNK